MYGCTRPPTGAHTGAGHVHTAAPGSRLSYGDSKAERGEAQARAERNYKRKRAALAEVARRRAAEDCGGGALSEPMDEAEEDASRRESASKVGSPTLGRYYDILPKKATGHGRNWVSAFGMALTQRISNEWKVFPAQLRSSV